MNPFLFASPWHTQTILAPPCRPHRAHQLSSTNSDSELGLPVESLIRLLQLTICRLSASMSQVRILSTRLTYQQMRYRTFNPSPWSSEVMLTYDLTFDSIRLFTYLFFAGKVSFLNASYDEIPLSDSSTVDRLTALGNAQVSTGASYYIGVLAALAFILAVLSSYLYFKIRWKFNRDNQEAEEQLLQQGVQASLRQQENQRVSRNMRHQE